MAADIRAIFNAPDRAQAEAQLRKTVEKYAQSASKLADWLEGNIPEGMTVFSFPEDHWRRIRTVNSLERVCLEIRRRTRVAGIFPNGASCCRLRCASQARSNYWRMEACTGSTRPSSLPPRGFSHNGRMPLIESMIN